MRAGYFPFAIVGIHLGSFVQVPSRLQPFTEVCGSTRPDVEYVSSDFEVGC